MDLPNGQGWVVGSLSRSMARGCYSAFGLLIGILALAMVGGCGDIPVEPAANAEPSSAGKSEKHQTNADTSDQGPKESPENPSAPPVQHTFATCEAAVKVLAKAVDSKHREQIVAVTTWLAAKGQDAVGPVGAAVRDRSHSLPVRMTACQVLSKIGHPATPALVQALQSDAKMVQLKAAEGLGEITPPKKETIDILLAVAKDESADDQVRRTAVKSIGQFGPAAKHTSEFLNRLVNSNASDSLRAEADRALRAVEPRRTMEFE